MSDAKPYTMDRLDAVLSEWEQGGKPRFVSADLRATVRALDAAQAENAALKARVAELEEARDEALHAGRVVVEAADEMMSKANDALEQAAAERDEWKAKAEGAQDNLNATVEAEGKAWDRVGEVEKQRDEAAAQAERLRKVLEQAEAAIAATARCSRDANGNYPQGPSAHSDGSTVTEFVTAVRAALSMPATAWLREHDRALVMQQREACVARLAQHIQDGGKESCATVRETPLVTDVKES